MKDKLKGAALAALILLAAGPAIAEEMNNLKLDDWHQIEQERAKAAAGAASSQPEAPPATTNQ